ncbi:hypothetical protein A2697_01135 [Candidatus Curtissbacteria bacterium RIFCSPHIGHO2_01_FULL_41_44]|uniref:Glycosyltransferase 2-like domain-containing protein n=1 Tax=Candidatus Curtissbacteria bacterium RIFCSPLOWO2_01_FULL_42_50 TaxID=1797730 RepID=A0A1F5H324_9BACT|nr:MAG: hypothetical protein A3C33_02435 [Candidatus Curtissbacteria bacterium RIFCSPHIGHO2_02_FULL_42_58]OGD94852.1 MAG: hypothetical protein A2697_01135 [Candidatus Curtissbacteria bacterium RIFCSPHIGHO2_01_FULL_41_44]OGD96453.1 MAG: hypothetical protein A3E71_02575 [Candidatus Curtissbacteria bacterium RIFCSPHIGHO2_12_FULL_42_33]OGD98479.1 MAG: hypothetical protein A3B54_04415 [Candidatus Curtissbacteria bacterium RIFCSPLOWO2_01_FULL_42_50]OGE02709.1 MAG: hypothetical protein A3G16_01900 [Ca
MDQLKIAIIVLNYNGIRATLECLDSLRRLKKDNYQVEIILVDNNSNDGSHEAFSKIKDVHFIRSEENLGYTGGNNLGIRHALKRQANYILVLNNDTIVDHLLLVNLLKATKNGDIVCPKVYFAPGFEFHKERYKKQERGSIIWYAGGKIDWDNIIGRHIGVDQKDKGQFAKRHPIDLATGACMLVKSHVFEKIGFFDEKYFLYLEDMDFCVRAKKAGFKIIFEPKAILWHKNAATAGGSGSRLQDYFITRNRLLFAIKYARLKTKLAVVRQSIRQLKDPVKRRAFWDFLTTNFGKGSFLK